MSRTVVKLTKPIAWASGTITELTIKEPTGQQYIDLGEPRTPVFSADNSGYWVEIPEKIKQYLDLCIEHEGGSLVLAQANIADARKIKAALLRFFTEGSPEPTKEPPKTSSSD